MNFRTGLVAAGILVFSGLFAAGCGDDSDDVDNVKACESLYDKMSCGMTDFSQYKSQCSTYSNDQYSCDLAPYFNCIEENIKCTDGFLDPSGWTACTAKAKCD